MTPVQCLRIGAIFSLALLSTYPPAAPVTVPLLVVVIIRAVRAHRIEAPRRAKLREQVAMARHAARLKGW